MRQRLQGASSAHNAFDSFRRFAHKYFQHQEPGVSQETGLPQPPLGNGAKMMWLALSDRACNREGFYELSDL